MDNVQPTRHGYERRHIEAAFQYHVNNGAFTPAARALQELSDLGEAPCGQRIAEALVQKCGPLAVDIVARHRADLPMGKAALTLLMVACRLPRYLGHYDLAALALCPAVAARALRVQPPPQERRWIDVDDATLRDKRLVQVAWCHRLQTCLAEGRPLEAACLATMLSRVRHPEGVGPSAVRPMAASWLQADEACRDRRTARVLAVATLLQGGGTAVARAFLLRAEREFPSPVAFCAYILHLARPDDAVAMGRRDFVRLSRTPDIEAAWRDCLLLAADPESSGVMEQCQAMLAVPTEVYEACGPLPVGKRALQEAGVKLGASEIDEAYFLNEEQRHAFWRLGPGSTVCPGSEERAPADFPVSVAEAAENWVSNRQEDRSLRPDPVLRWAARATWRPRLRAALGDASILPPGGQGSEDGGTEHSEETDEPIDFGSDDLEDPSSAETSSEGSCAGEATEESSDADEEGQALLSRLGTVEHDPDDAPPRKRKRAA